MNHPDLSNRRLARVAALALLTAAGCGSSVDAAGEPTTTDTVSASPEPDPAGPGARHRRHPIPEEAIVACEGADEGAECDVDLPARTLEGTCREGPNGEALACAPPFPPPGPPPGAEGRPPGPPPGAEGRPPGPPPGAEGRPPGPPAEALAACAEQAAGDACTARLPAVRLPGICRRPPDPEAPLACAPRRPLPPPPPSAAAP
ncbi:MAG: hypothetical protein IT376_13705 [Polyangiaceae bacterium]|nr:hypothetical protein [Polyangiaceae bacterium]